MEITTTKENLLEKLKIELTVNALKNLEDSELTAEEKDATLVLRKRSIENDAKIISDIVFAAFAD